MMSSVATTSGAASTAASVATAAAPYVIPVGKENPTFKMDEDDNATPLMKLTMQINKGIKKETTPVEFEALLIKVKAHDSGYQLIQADTNGRTVLHKAAEVNNCVLIRYLVSQPGGQDLAELGNPWGDTALMSASTSGHLEAAEALIESGADVNTSAHWRIHDASEDRYPLVQITPVMSVACGGPDRFLGYMIMKGGVFSNGPDVGWVGKARERYNNAKCDAQIQYHELLEMRTTFLFLHVFAQMIPRDMCSLIASYESYGVTSQEILEKPKNFQTLWKPVLRSLEKSSAISLNQ
jgi:hypothetical protein